MAAAMWFWRLLTVQPISHHAVTVYSGGLGWLRSNFLGGLSGVNQEAKALVAGLTIGDTSQLSNVLKSDMKVVSLTHLNAVSGANCAIVVAVIYWLLSKTAFPRALRLTITMLTLGCYAVLVGPQASVLRASAMAALVILTQAIGRRISGSRILAMAVLLLLAIDPQLAIDIGFQLSVAATLGILILAPRLTERLSTRLPRWLSLSLAVTAAAQIACTPLLLQLQPGFSTYSVLANLICEPLVAPVTILGMMACLCSVFFVPLASALSWVASLFTFLIAAVAHFFAGLPAATLNQVGGEFGLALTTAATVAVAVWLTSRRQKRRIIALAALGAICALELGSCSHSIIESGNWPLKDWSVISCDVGQGDATLIRSEGKIALIDVGRDPKPIDGCLKHLSITHLDLLLLTHFDLDHVGGLTGALRNRHVEVGMITGYHDPRPAAAITYRELRLAVHHLVTAETNLTGTLGGFSWQVLSPHRDAPEAEDSNDGSVTVLFRSQYVNVLTLADLGERGQMRLAAESSNWLGQGFGSVPMIVKVSHHGSADQYSELYEAIRPVVALISVGLHNPYGHPTNRTLTFLKQIGSHIFRTDRDGAISVAVTPSGLRVTTAGRL